MSRRGFQVESIERRAFLSCEDGECAIQIGSSSNPSTRALGFLAAGVPCVSSRTSLHPQHLLDQRLRKLILPLYFHYLSSLHLKRAFSDHLLRPNRFYTNIGSRNTADMAPASVMGDQDGGDDVRYALNYN